MSAADPLPPADETVAPAPAPAAPAPSAAKKSLYAKLTKSLPLTITLVVHLVIFLIAGVFVVQEQFIGKKKVLEASQLTESTAQKQVEHRLQVARRGGAAGGTTSPVAANRIFSTNANAVALPSMTDIPTMGAAGFGGFSGAGGIGINSGNSISTSLGPGTNIGGRGFMSMTFLGMTSQNAQRVVFLVPVGTSMMDIRKGGFRAFEIIREEIMRLVGGLPPTTQFNVILYGDDRGDMNLFARELQPATSANKDAFFEWMKPVNATNNRFGTSTAGKRTGWRRKPLAPDAGINPLYEPPVWITPLQAALEQEPTTIYAITGTAGSSKLRMSDDEMAKAQREKEAEKKKLEAEGVDVEKARQARGAAFAKARAELDKINQQLTSQGKDPFVVRDTTRIMDRDFQAALQRAGFSIKVDMTGWTDKAGRQIWWDGWVNPYRDVPYTEVYNHVSRLQKALVSQNANINVFLFSGPDEKRPGEERDLTTLARRNGGNFQLLTTKRLEEIRNRALQESNNRR